MKDTQYVTTTIPYVNAAPHVGFAFELVQADAIARYHRLCGRSVQFQTGTDENAFKNVLSARALSIPIREFVDQNASRFRELCDALSISQDRFVRTAEAGHYRAVHAFLSRLQPGDVYQTGYRGLYCAGCEDFYLERDLDDGRCPDHKTPVVEIAEQNHFFRLSAYQYELRALIASRRLRILPESRELEVLRFIDGGLTDISLSRDAARSGGWGVPFPGDDEQVVYVWIDALVNYLSGLGFPSAESVNEFWGPHANRLHVIGRNVWKFHAIYWPALLLSAGLEVPDSIFVHGFLTFEGEKISKSSGNAPDPLTYTREFGAEAVRYYLLRLHPFEDTDFSAARLAAAYEADLANGIGNLFSRLTALCEAAECASPVRATTPPALPGFHEHIEAFRIDLAIEVLWSEIRQLNQLLNSERPWDDLKLGHREAARLKLEPVVVRLDTVAHWLTPFLPSTADAIRSALAQPFIQRAAPLFPRRT